MARSRASRRIQTRAMRVVSRVYREPAHPEDHPDRDGQTETIRLRARSRDFPRTRAQKRRFITQLMDLGVIDAPGCRCSHCENDWDCCGRLFVASTSVHRARRGLTVVQHYLRNV